VPINTYSGFIYISFQGNIGFGGLVALIGLLYSTSFVLFTLMTFATDLHACAKFNVDSDSLHFSAEGDTAAINRVQQFPPKESFKINVNLESLY